jgi:hypothetical protein
MPDKTLMSDGQGLLSNTLFRQMDRPQLIRRLRIATSVFFAVVTVALCVLWVRSYWRTDTVTRMDNVLTMFGSANGHIYFYRGKSNYGRSGWRWNTNQYNPHSADSGWVRTNHFTLISIPFGIAVPVVTISAAISWVLASKSPPRFSLRTLLIATTLIAVALGLGAWAVG